jgi:hypothetical protein
MLGSVGASATAARAAVEVGFVTDVEGNLDYFDRWVARSGVLRYAGPTTLELTHPGAYFVFGGDVMDRCDGGQRLARRLVDLKRRVPDRVFLLAGNRDLNKFRLTSELSQSDMARRPHEIPRPHWDPKAPTLQEYLAASGLADSRATRLRYYLRHTFGCPNTFDVRRAEIAIIRGCAEDSVTDDDVVESMVGDVQPGGALREYLEHAQIACILGCTIFVHGALDSYSIRHVPGDATRFTNPSEPPEMRYVEKVRDWVAEMNGVLSRGLEAHAASPDWHDETRSTRGGEVLMALQNRCALFGRSVVSGAYAHGGCITTPKVGNLRKEIFERLEQDHDALITEALLADPRDPDVATWLQGAGVRRVVVGHKPSGDSPAVLSSSYTGVEVISADTSYADPDDVNGRGVSIAGVSLLGESLERNAARIFGVLSDGREHDATLATLGTAGRPADAPGDEMVGRELQDGWWVKAKMRSESTEPTCYRCARGQGRVVEYRNVGADGAALD